MDEAKQLPPGVREASRREIYNPATSEVAHFLKYGHETGGEYTEATVTCQQDGGPPLHYHHVQVERFEALEGDAIFQLGDAPPRPLEIGEKVEVPVGTIHRFTAGANMAKFRVEVIPASEDFEKSLYILFGLARDGLVGKDGLPKSPVHTAVVAKMGGMYFPGASGLLINSVTGALAAYARWTGVQDALVKKYWH